MPFIVLKAFYYPYDIPLVTGTQVKYVNLDRYMVDIVFREEIENLIVKVL